MRPEASEEWRIAHFGCEGVGLSGGEVQDLSAHSAATASRAASNGGETARVRRDLRLAGGFDPEHRRRVALATDGGACEEG